MQVAILSARTGWHTGELCRALLERGHSGRVVAYEHLVASLGAAPDRAAGAPGIPSVRNRRSTPGRRLAASGCALSSDGRSLLDADAVLARIIPGGSLEQIIFRVDALHWIEEHGTTVMNTPRAIERCVDKFYTDALLREAGLPTPETVVCEGLEQARAAVRAMGEVVIKPIFGSMGHGLVRVGDPDVAFRVLRSLETTRAVFYVQRAVAHEGRDVRVFVVGGAVLGAIERQAPAGEWRANVARGARVTPVALPPAWDALALRAAAAIGADYAGIDLLPCEDGSVLVLEVNGIPGWQGLQQATGVDVAGAIVEHLVSRVHRARGPASERPA
jgi:RimK family alpha-L-glutamate ligase